MADIIKSVFRSKKADFSKLAAFGFAPQGEGFIYREKLSGCGFVLNAFVSSQGEVSAEIIDPELNERYVLHLVEGAAGSFVGGVKSQYEEILNRIARECFEPDVFKSKQAAELIAYVRETYRDELEYLWQRLPDNAVWRRKDTGKWYAALLTIQKSKLGFESAERAEIIDLRVRPQELEGLLDGRRYFPGYHMNKRRWYTMLLDSSIPTAELCRRIDESYALAVK
ncbi:MAG: MmcQ/YjbR family DNA-binding protein [Oscillospiraceae bacterium]|nr:MmcQ/YjbR family DNA-binding protein [Oscillospiraceae bacterium]